MPVFEAISYWLAWILFKIVTAIFFRGISKRNTYKIPLNGPVIFVAAPHANQFVDPLILMSTCPRIVHFLAAAATLRRKIPGFFGRLMGSIPVERACDLSVKGMGTIRPDRDDRRHKTIIGIGTNFISQITSDNIMLCLTRDGEDYSYVIEKVLDNEKLLLRHALDDCVISAFDSVESLPYKIQPKIDHHDLYNSVFESLAEGNCIGIFPEGGSHDRAEMLPLKAGVAIMALGAMAKYPNVEVTIVPCGLTYFHPDKFRSRAMIEYGDPFKVEPELVNLFKRGGEHRREACGKLLNRIYYALCNVTINAPDMQTLQTVQAFRRLYQPTKQPLSSFELLEVTRRFSKAIQVLKNDPKMRQLIENVNEYNQLLETFQIYDHQVNDVPFSRLRAFSLLLIKALYLALFALLVLPGFVFNFPALVIIDSISKSKQAEALAKSSVKVEAKDVIASWKLIISFILLPVMYMIYATISWVYFYHCGDTVSHALFKSLCMIPAFPIFSFVLVLFAEQGYATLYSIGPLWLCLTSPAESKLLYTIRQKLKVEIIKAVDEFGPKVFGADFATQRIVPPRRRSSVAAAEVKIAAIDRSQITGGLIEEEEDDFNPMYVGVEDLIQKVKTISRTPSPSINDHASCSEEGEDDDDESGHNPILSGLHYMKSRVSEMVEKTGGALEFAGNLEWSHIDQAEIDDVFFSTTGRFANESKKTK